MVTLMTFNSQKREEDNNNNNNNNNNNTKRKKFDGSPKMLLALNCL